jgi:hypothetical protein
MIQSTYGHDVIIGTATIARTCVVLVRPVFTPAGIALCWGIYANPDYTDCLAIREKRDSHNGMS